MGLKITLKTTNESDYSMDLDKRAKLVEARTQEVVTHDELVDLLKTKKNPVAYWGTAPTGRVHTGYFIPVMKFKDFIDAGFTFKILLADLHAHLDDQKSPWDLLKYRSEYYKQVLLGMLKSAGVKTSSIEFVTGSSFQLKEDYTMNMLRVAANVTLKRARRAASEVVRFKEDPKLGGFVYPLMQVLDVHFLNADVAFGGIDQRGIYMLGRELMPELGFKKYVSVFNPMLPGLTGDKMSASNDASKIDVLDSTQDITHKVSKAYCPAKVLEGNGITTFVEHVILPLRGEFSVVRPDKFGGNKTFNTFDEVKKDFVSGALHPADLKAGVAKEIDVLVKPVRKRFATRQSLVEKAYPNA